MHAHAQDLVPLCIIFLSTGWAASLFIAWLAFTQLTALRRMHTDERTYLQHLVDAYSEEVVAIVKQEQGGGGGGTAVARRVSFTLARQLEVRALVI